jgi:hypothetical protein
MVEVWFRYLFEGNGALFLYVLWLDKPLHVGIFDPHGVIGQSFVVE